MAYNKLNLVNGQKLTAEHLAHMEAGIAEASTGKHASAYNLLDNSYFRNPIAQAGQNGTHGSNKYALDRWISWDADVTFGNGYITPGSPIDQRIDPALIDTSKLYTVAMQLDNGTVLLSSGNMDTGFGTYATVYAGFTSGSGYFVRVGERQNVRWVALYEGAYTEETLPEYVYKGYAAEMAECQRYYYQFQILAGTGASAAQRVFVTLPVNMRVLPSIEYSLLSGDAPSFVTAQGTNTIDVKAAATYSHLYIKLSADL